MKYETRSPRFQSSQDRHSSSEFAKAMAEERIESNPPPLPPSPMEKLNDFSDRLSPMLVKELRQGLRTHTFVIVFLILQGLLALILLTTTVANINAGGFVSSIIFFFFGLAVMVIQPLRGMSAISSEIKSDTIDLMSLTKLTAWRIVFGKWSSIMGQTALLLFAIIPYLILRYFFGGMQLFSELLLLGTIFFLSGIFTAITVGLSACPLALVRVVPLLTGLYLVYLIPALAFGAFEQTLQIFTPKSSDHWLGLVAAYAIGGFIAYFFLELAATAIAPSAENRATRKRLITFLVIPLTFIVLREADHDVAWGFTWLLLFMVSIDFFTENANYPSSVLKPFLRFGFLGRVGARFLAPGWATGTLFHLTLFVVIILISLALGEELRNPKSLEQWVITGVMLGILYLPHLLVQIFAKRISNRLVTYLLFSVLLLGILPLLAMLDNLGDTEMVVWVFCFIPHVQLFLERYCDTSTHVTIVWITTGIYLLGSLLFAFKPLANLSKMETEEIARNTANQD